MALIGSIVIGMSAQTDKLERGLARSAAAIDRFSKGAAAAADRALHGLTTAGIVAGGALARFALECAEAIDKTGDAADRIGTTTAAFASLRYAAQLTGSETEGLEAAMLKLGNNLADAATKGGPAADALKTLGLDAKKLLGLDPAEQFKAIAGGMQSIASPAQRASLAMDLFGKSGVGFLNTLSAGPAEIERLSAEFRGLGGAIDETSRQSVGAMFDAFDRLKAAAAAVGGSIAVKLAPALSEAADKARAMLSEGGGNMLAATAEKIAATISRVMERAERIGPVFRLAFAVVEARINVVLWALEKVSDVLDPILKKLDAIRGESGAIGAGVGQLVTPELKKLLGDEGAKPRKPIDLSGQTAEAKKVSDAIDEMERGLKSEIATFGQAEGMAEIYKLKLKGATDEQLKGVKALAMQRKELEKNKAMQERMTKEYADSAHAIWEETRTPLERYQEKIEKIRKAQKGGAIDDETAARAFKAAGKDLGLQPKFAGALDVGSREARSAILAATSGKADGFVTVEKNTGATARGVGEMVGLMRQLARGPAGSRPSEWEMS